jgi:hypothetical protein
VDEDERFDEDVEVESWEEFDEDMDPVHTLHTFPSWLRTSCCFSLLNVTALLIIFTTSARVARAVGRKRGMSRETMFSRTSASIYPQNASDERLS